MDVRGINVFASTTDFSYRYTSYNCIKRFYLLNILIETSNGPAIVEKKTTYQHLNQLVASYEIGKNNWRLLDDSDQDFSNFLSRPSCSRTRIFFHQCTNNIFLRSCEADQSQTENTILKNIAYT